MGIQGLLPLLKSIMVPIHVKELEGCSVAVDTYSWLHKGALSCSRELCKGLPTTRHIEYCMHRVNLLRHCGVKPILVFDGGLLPMKSEQENKRARVRKENLARGIEHESNGNSAAAYECYQKAVDISPLIAHELIQVLKQENVSYIVAPYEADAQMTFLAVGKQVEAVITEDSDLIPFGCPRIIFKMDKFGQGVEFRYSMLQQNKELSFAGFTKQMLLEMCILSGCDYLQSLPGMGLKRAHALIKKFKSYDKVIKHLRYSTVSVPPLYEESFKKAMLTFQHQRVYDPVNEDVAHLSDISDNGGVELDFLGPLIPQDTAKGIAEGNLDPFTKIPFQGENVRAPMVLERTSQCKQFNPERAGKMLDLPVQKNLLTKYFCFASLEAKRKFRAPRTSPNHPSPDDDSSFIPKETVTVEAAVCKMDCLSESPLDSKNTGTDLPANNPVSYMSRIDDNKLQVDDSFATKISVHSESPTHDMGPETRSPEETLLQQPRYSIHKPCTTLQKERECKNLPDAVEGKTRTETRKVVVRSSYFQHKSENQAKPNNEQQKTKNDGVVDTHKNNIPEDYSFRNNHIMDMFRKRKSSLNDSIKKEDVQPKHRRGDAPFPKNGHDTPELSATSSETVAEEKFGSNISHLSRYSEIAEKSIENFVSVISSFGYTSSGSRASGLRAPLKDVRNTCINRPTDAGMDFSQFAYVPPNKQKVGLASRKG